ncbi:MAG: UTP--glucose-1-phosphate uridylyltransferase GalU [Dethiobacteria bacterium]|nr:UTP--glucose-1-phosphate uridylyltransferase GalU [Bacillota bacterium]HPZ65021.1 UTP--glucose-1-phosphate uridylyltransferase GalU [Bacillota bacterium]HQD06967.1 UTP--glucose-1-phosphate uridylyltransferase GalU [Bacillota bacterium]
MKVKKAVIPAAGLGTRFLPATKAQPKEMLPIVDKPTIQYVVEEAVAAGIEDILIITGRNKRAIEDHFDYCVELEHTLEKKGKKEDLSIIRGISEMADIFYVRQKEPLGLGHAIGCARKFIGNEPFAVLLGDDIIYAEVPCIRQLIDVYESLGGSVLGVQPVDWGQVNKYGIVEPGEKAAGGATVKVKSLVEKPSREEAPSNLAVLGRYVIEPEIFDILESTPPGAGGEIQLTDALNSLAQMRPVWAYTFQGRRYDVGDRLGFLEATIEYALRREDLAEGLMRFLKRLVAAD